MTPKYEQLVHRLRAALPQWYADGQRKLPGEQALAAQLSVSRQTLRQALAVLEQEGLIEKRRGSGSFLCPAAARQDRRIAVIATSLSDYIFPSLLKDVQACLSAQGFSVVIHATENSIRRERDILQQLLLVCGYPLCRSVPDHGNGHGHLPVPVLPQDLLHRSPGLQLLLPLLVIFLLNIFFQFFHL